MSALISLYNLCIHICSLHQLSSLALSCRHCGSTMQ